jgi:heat shock protein HtpX
MYSSTYPDIPLSQIFAAITSLQLFPTVTLIMIIVAAVSLFITFTCGNRLMLLGTEYHEITPDNAQNLQEKQLYNIVEELKIAAGLQFMPKVYLIDADYMNAFASGYSEKSAMVAITRGLINKLNREELQAVMAHEISHIRRMDIKLTLMASILANLILIILDLLFYQMVFSRNSNNNRRGLETIVILLRYLLPIINVLLLLYLSRTREYMADAGCVELLRDNQPLASALIKINSDHDAHRNSYAAEYQKTPHENIRREAYIFDPQKANISGGGTIADLFSTHPSLKDRLNALGFRYNEPK